MDVINLKNIARNSFEINPEVFGYEYITTADYDFFIAEVFGQDTEKAIKETYESLFKNFENGYKELTELVMVLNWRLWGHYEKKNIEIAKVYNDLWEELREYCLNNFTDEAREYYFNTTD